MYPVKPKYRDSPYMRDIYEFTHAVERRIPTFTKTLDRYFDAHFEGIIEEWQLLTEHGLRDLENRLENVTVEINKLYSEKSVLEKRASALEAEVTALEKGGEAE